jgi:signal transduction histidine kinase
VAKHAQASHVAVLMHRQRNQIFMIVEDDGTGFDVASPPPSAEGHGNGLIGMRERVELLGGKLLIESSDKGTSIAVTVPAIHA